MSTRRLLYSNNLRGSGVAVARALPGDYAALGGISSFTRADASTCASYHDVNGVRQLAAANVLRDGHYVGGLRTILLEETRDNAVIQSGVLSNAAWGTSGLTSRNLDAVGPNGIASNANTLVASGAAAAWVRRITTTLTAAAGTSVIEGYFKRSNVDYAVLWDGGDAADHRAWFNLATGAVGTQENATGYIEALATGFFRCYLVYPTTNAYNQRVQLGLARTDGSTVVLAGDTIIASDGQGEPTKTFGTSHIPTVATTVTRATDALTLTGTSAFAGRPNTLYLRYFDLATRAWTDAASAYTAGDPIVPAVNRSYSLLAVLAGTFTAAQCRQILGGSLG